MTVLEDMSPAAVIAAVEASAAGFVRIMGEGPGMRLHERYGCIQCVSGFPIAALNLACGGRFSPEGVDREIEEVLAPLRNAGFPMLWWIGPDRSPPDLGVRLAAHGVMGAGTMPGMAIDLLAWKDRDSVDGLVVERVTSRDMTTAMVQVMQRGFDLPAAVAGPMIELLTCIGFEDEGPMHNFLGLLDGRPVASATLLLDAGVAGLYNIATIPEAQRKGIGTAITGAALRYARDRGLRVGVLDSSQRGYAVYRRLGFREYCTLDVYYFAGGA